MTPTCATNGQMRKPIMLASRKGLFGDWLDLIILTLGLLWFSLNIGTLTKGFDEARQISAVDAIRDAFDVTDISEGASSVNVAIVVGDGVTMLYDCQSLSKETKLVYQALNDEKKYENETLDPDVLASIKSECKLTQNGQARTVVFVQGVFTDDEQTFKYVLEKFYLETNVVSALTMTKGSKTLHFERVGGLNTEDTITISEVGEDSN